ncbi:MAG: site-2 protease family protein [Patescibacteria group bacterium]
MLIQLLLNAPLFALAWVVAIIISLTVHEFAHALVGTWRGDHTAEQMGRLTLNPLAHLDPIGTLMLLFVGFGWAKPVPFDPRNLKNPAWDGVAIAFAGPLSNLLLATLAGVAYRNLADLAFAEGTLLPIFLILLIFTNLLLLFFNMLPIPPLDGSKVIDAVLHRTRYERFGLWLHIYGPRILLGLVILSLITNISIFGFIQAPAILACDEMTGVSCLGSLDEALGT